MLASAAHTAAIYTLSLHDALPIFLYPAGSGDFRRKSLPGADILGVGHPYFVIPAKAGTQAALGASATGVPLDRKSTRLNSSHVKISYAVFCLNKKRIQIHQMPSVV